MPDIQGLESFKGDCFHTARWDHNVELKGKRIGVIGAGDTAIDCALVAKRLSESEVCLVYRRTIDRNASEKKLVMALRTLDAERREILDDILIAPRSRIIELLQKQPR